MTKAVYKKTGIMVLAVIMILSSALVMSLTNNVSVSNAFSGYSGGTSILTPWATLTSYSGTVSSYPDGTTRSASLNQNYCIFYYNPTPANLVKGIEYYVWDDADNLVPVYGITGSYGGPGVGYIPTNLYQFTLPHKGNYTLYTSVKDVYGYVYNRWITITYN